MRILLAHNFYRTSAPSGEDVVFRNEHDLLERHGIEVIPYVVHNDNLDDRGLLRKIRIAAKTVWSGQSSESLRKLIASSRPDLVHFHNTFPQISPSAYAACRRAGVPVVQTLHNYRLICPGALLLRDGVPCESCVGSTLLHAVRHRCYRGSLPATATLAAMLAVNRRLGSYTDNVDRYIALTEFAASRLRAGGLPGERISVKPNFLPDDPQPGRGGGGYAVFVGRLSSEKGLHTLLRAWRHLPNLPLKILGDGPLRSQLEQQVASGRIPAGCRDQLTSM